VEAVLALPEPYREMVVRRYFHGATPTEIAARLDLPVKTVKTRLHRALERLRRELDERYGSRAAWAVVALPIAKSAVPTAIATKVTGGSVSILEWLGGFVMAGSKLGAAAAVILVIVAGLWWWSDSLSPETGNRSDVAQSADDEPEVRDRPSAAALTAGRNSGAPEAESEGVVRGVVVERDNGEPIVGARVQWITHSRPMTVGWYLRKGSDRREATGPREAKLGDLALSLPFDSRRETTAPGAASITNGAGEFELPAAPEGAIYLRVTHEEYRYGFQSVGDVAPGMRLELARKRWVTIDVLDPDGRVPDSPRALVHGYVYGQLDAAPEWEVYRSFHWDDRGVARIELPDVYRVRVSISAPKFGWKSEAAGAIGEDYALDLDLEPHPFVGARVVNPSGDPIPGVEAVVFHASADHPSRTGTVIQCGDDGRFVANVRADGPVFVAFTAEGYAGREIDHLERGRDDPVVVLEPATLTTVTGVVTGTEERPVEGRTIELTNATLSGPLRSTAVDAAGRFAFDAVPPGRYDAIVWSETESGIRSRLVGLEGTPFEVSDGPARVELSVAPDSGRIFGSVETPERGPVTDTMLFLDRVTLLGSAETISVTVVDDQGRYGFGAVPAGRYLVKVGFGSSVSQLVRVRPGEASEAHFGRDSRRVTLELSRRGEPVADASLIAGRFDTTGATPLLTDVRVARTDAEGRAGKNLYRAGRYLVRVEGERSAFVEIFDLTTDERTPITIPVEWPENALTLEADESGAFTVDLVEVDGIELKASVPLVQRRIGYGETSPGATAEDLHRFTIDGVAAARYQLTFTTIDGVARTRVVDVPPSGLRLRVDTAWQPADRH
ncbi:MAG: carboxypeptidase regulatory-like domain-containing protein, partial [Planctomycetota bacterium]